CHPDAAASLESYAIFLRKTNRASEAITMEERARVIETRTARGNSQSCSKLARYVILTPGRRRGNAQAPREGRQAACGRLALHLGPGDRRSVRNSAAKINLKLMPAARPAPI